VEPEIDVAGVLPTGRLQSLELEVAAAIAAFSAALVEHNAISAAYIGVASERHMEIVLPSAVAPETQARSETALEASQEA